MWRVTGRDLRSISAKVPAATMLCNYPSNEAVFGIIRQRSYGPEKHCPALYIGWVGRCRGALPVDTSSAGDRECAGYPSRSFPFFSPHVADAVALGTSVRKEKTQKARPKRRPDLPASICDAMPSSAMPLRTVAMDDGNLFNTPGDEGMRRRKETRKRRNATDSMLRSRHIPSGFLGAPVHYPSGRSWEKRTGRFFFW